MNYGYYDLAMEALAGVPSGRLFKYSTKTKTVTLLLSGLLTDLNTLSILRTSFGKWYRFK